MHWQRIGKLLVLLMIANGAPVIAQKAFGGRWSQPLDGGKVWHDGRPVFGTAKTVRGIICSIAATIIVAPALGVSWTVGLGAGTAAMAGDLFSSFIKRWLGLSASERAIGLDQLPESLFPALVCAYKWKLEWPNVVIVTAAFFVGQMALSRLLYALRIRARPY
jgi:CDP-diglyceride synthetase